MEYFTLSDNSSLNDRNHTSWISKIMSSVTSGSGTVTRTRVLDRRVSISKWVNEKNPAWDQVLAAHDITRLTRRQRWILSTLTILGRFPKKQRFRRRKIGWQRASVLSLDGEPSCWRGAYVLAPEHPSPVPAARVQ
jgi:hypothetical protein